MSIPWPKDNYVLTFTKGTFGVSKRTDNPMGTFELEVFSPSTMSSGSYEITVAGTPLKHYLVTKVLDEGEVDTEKTATATERVKDFYEKCGVNFATYNPENPDFTAFEGKKIWALLKNKRTEKRKDQTPEQKAEGEQGTILKDPISGAELVNNYPEIESIFGVADV